MILWAFPNYRFLTGEHFRTCGRPDILLRRPESLDTMLLASGPDQLSGRDIDHVSLC